MTSSLRRSPMRRKKNEQGQQTIAGVLWPEGYLREEPKPGWKKGRDDCFRWRVEDLLHATGWTFFHLSDKSTRWSDAGVPDLWCMRERIMYLELKVRYQNGAANTLSPEQWAFAKSVINAGGEYHCIVYPDDWDELTRIVAR